MELAVLVLIHRSLEYNGKSAEALSVERTSSSQIYSRNATITANTSQINLLTTSPDGLSPIEKCSKTIVVECLERGAVLWSIIGITSVTTYQ